MEKFNNSVRRHHRERIKAKRTRTLKAINPFVFSKSRIVAERMVNSSINTAKPCSCHMCGNYRKNYGNSSVGKTVQELSFSQTEKWQ